MLSKFFINRPVFAMVVSIVIVIAGLVTMFTLPVSLYPDIAPPTVTVTTSYPGASSQVLADTVAQPIEEQVNGVDHMLYMSSVCANDGSYKLTVTFEVGTNLDIASVLVQNRVSIALPRLPHEVQRQGVVTLKQSTDFVVFISLYSPDKSISKIDLDNYATINLVDPLTRIKGVGSVALLGGNPYGMRVWVDPNKVQSLGMTIDDVVDAIRAQNVQVAAGVIGQPPVPKGQDFQYNISVLGRLSDPQQFADIIIKTGNDGQVTRVKDVGTVDLGAQNYNTYSELNSSPASVVAVYQLPGANALDVARDSRALIEDMSKKFPENMEYQITYDASWFVNASIDEIKKTLFIAVLLVIATVFVFLQDWRASFITAITIPVSLIGTFALMGMLGFSINTLTMFGLVLAIGIVVDDAIIIVENCTRNLADRGGSPREAAIAAMKEVTGPIVATTLVLMAVFVPTGFMSGITGQMYRQFALTIAASTLISAINALTLSPALCALLLRVPDPNKKKNLFFRGFNFGLEKTHNVYIGIVSKTLRRGVMLAVLMGACFLITGWCFKTTPTGFIPMEDQGYLIVNIQLPDATSLERTRKVVDKVTEIAREMPATENIISIGGYSMLDGTCTSNYGAVYIMLKPWDQRTKPKDQIKALIKHINEKAQEIQSAQIVVFSPPAIPGLGITDGFQFQLEDRGSLGSQMLQEYAEDMIGAANSKPAMSNVYTTFRANVPEIYVDIDRTKAMTLGVEMDDIFDTMQAYMGSLYVNDFNKFGQVYQVLIQAQGKFRNKNSDIGALAVRNRDNQTLILDTMIKLEERFAPQVITRYNLYPTATITGGSAPGYSSGQAIKLMEQISNEQLPDSMGYEWSGISYQQIKAGNQAPYIFALGGLFVYLFLSAQYESFRIPLAVMLSLPFALLGAIVGTMMRGLDNNIYTQIGIVLLIGMASKIAILIVEFAKTRHDEHGEDRFEAAKTAASLRFRAILMTAFAGLLGWSPLLIATGAGAASRRALGTAIFSGMVAATVIGLIFIPGLYVIVQFFGDWFAARKANSSDQT